MYVHIVQGIRYVVIGMVHTATVILTWKIMMKLIGSVCVVEQDRVKASDQDAQQ